MKYKNIFALLLLLNSYHTQTLSFFPFSQIDQSFSTYAENHNYNSFLFKCFAWTFTVLGSLHVLEKLGTMYENYQFSHKTDDELLELGLNLINRIDNEFNSILSHINKYDLSIEVLTDTSKPLQHIIEISQVNKQYPYKGYVQYIKLYRKEIIKIKPYIKKRLNSLSKKALKNIYKKDPIDFKLTLEYKDLLHKLILLYKQLDELIFVIQETHEYYQECEQERIAMLARSAEIQAQLALHRSNNSYYYSSSPVYFTPIYLRP